MIRATGGFFTVRDGRGEEHLCRARGRLKRRQEQPAVGDRVSFKPGESGAAGERAAAGGMIEEILPRRNRLTRPPVANVDRLILVMALRDPAPDWRLAGRLLVQAEREGVAAVLCLNKADLVGRAEIEHNAGLLNPFPYPLLFTSAKTGRGTGRLASLLRDCCSVFAGPSGAGKSSLLNLIQPGLRLRTGEVSEKGGRGRHTTRMAELLPLDSGGLVVDTPGFSRVDFGDLEPAELPLLFPEFESYTRKCAFRNCSHLAEPGCAVREASGAGAVNPLRYRHYRLFLQELMHRRNGPRCR